MYKSAASTNKNESQAAANSVGQKKSEEQQDSGFADNRPVSSSLRKQIQMMNQGAANQSKGAKRKANNLNRRDVVQKVCIGREPEFPDNYRLATRITGSTIYHYGGGDFNIHAGVFNNNAQNLGNAAVNARQNAQEGPISDYSGNRLLTPQYARNYTPEIDHIVTQNDLGSNSYSNARVLSKGENNSPLVDNNRPPENAIATVAHDNLEIVYDDGIDENYYENHLGIRDWLNDDDLECIDIFGGLGQAIDAVSGTTQNNVTLTEE